MNPGQIVANLNRQNERLEQENKRLEEEITSLGYYRKEVENQAYIIYNKDITLHVLSEQIGFLRSQISLIEASSASSAYASGEAIKSLWQTLHNTRRENQLLNHELSQETVQLQNEIARVHCQSSKSESEVRENLAEIFRLKSTVQMNNMRHDKSEHKVSLIRSKLQNLSNESHALVNTRDDLIKHLNISNSALRKNNKRKTQDLQKQIREYDWLKKSLRQDIANEERLQTDLQISSKENEQLQGKLEYFRAEDTKQQDTISSIQRQLKHIQSEEKAKGHQDTIRYKTVEIEKLRGKISKKDQELEAKDRCIEDLTATIKRSLDTIKIKEAAATALTGGVLAHSIKSIDSIREEKISISIEITGYVFKLLKGIDSAKKARVAANAIRGYLETAKTRMTYVAKEAKEIEDLIIHITDLVNETKEPKAFQLLIDDVSSLQKALESTTK